MNCQRGQETALRILLVLLLTGCAGATPAEQSSSFPPPNDGPFGDWRSFYPSTSEQHGPTVSPASFRLGPRPAALAAALPDGPLRNRLTSCTAEPQRSDFSIAHRGATRLFPEHTREAYIAAARQGAGIIECDVTFTRDGALVCRHSQCDLHRTTNILETPLAERCRVPFEPATDEADAQVECCASDITLTEFKSLCGRHDDANLRARTPADYLRGPSSADPERYPHCGTLLTLSESISLIEALGAKHTPELKQPQVPMPFDTTGDGQGDLTVLSYADQLLAAYRAQNVAPQNVFPQSFELSVVTHWLETAPAFADQVVFLDGRGRAVDPLRPSDPGAAGAGPTFADLQAAGLRIIAPPLWMLVQAEHGTIVPSAYGVEARRAGLDLIGWTLERSGSLMEDVKTNDAQAFYYLSTRDVLSTEGDILTTLDVLYRKLGVRGVFSDWPATTTFYANCTPPPPRAIKR